MSIHGPVPGSEGAKRIGEAHLGGHPHDKSGGFAHSRELAVRAGKKGGLAVKNKYGIKYLRELGKQGGENLKNKYGKEFYARIGRLGGLARARKDK